MQGPSVIQAGEQRSARIESLRAAAALAVVVGHVYGASHAFAPSVYDGYARRVVLGGGFGVFLFFALTGYLLFWPFLKESLRGGRVDLGAYARNRALRILPLYYAVVVILLLVQERGGSFGQWWRFLTFSENFSHATIGTVDGVVWSLVIELQFYVLLPVLAWVLLRLGRGSLTRVAGLLLCIGGASLALRLAFVTFRSVPDPFVQFSLPTTFFFFIAGMLVAVARLAAEGRSLRIGADTLLLCSVPVWAAVFYRYSWEPLCAVAAMLMVGACVLPLRPGRLVRALEWRPLAAVGVASYSLYLWHFPLVVHIAWVGHTLRSFVVLVPLSLGVAFASYYAIESPFLRLRRRWAAAAPAQGSPETPELRAVPETAS